MRVARATTTEQLRVGGQDLHRLAADGARRAEQSDAAANDAVVS